MCATVSGEVPRCALSNQSATPVSWHTSVREHTVLCHLLVFMLSDN